MSLFDFHVRLTGRPGALDALLSTMDSCGIARAAVAAGGLVDLDELSRRIVDGGRFATAADNDRVGAACAGSGGRLVPFWFANPFDPVSAYRRQAADFRALEISPAVHGVELTDRRVLALVEAAGEAGHPVYVVCLGRPGTRAADLVHLAATYPEVTFVLGHCGFIGIDADAVGRVASVANIVAETSGCFSVVARLALDRLGPQRVVFGTEYPLQHPTVELAKFAALDLPAPDWRSVSWCTPHRLLGEEPT